MKESIEYYKYKVGSTIYFYKHYIDRKYAIKVDVGADRIGKVSSITLKGNIGKRSVQKKIKPVWSEVPVYITTMTTEKLFNHHFNNVVNNLR